MRITGRVLSLIDVPAPIGDAPSCAHIAQFAAHPRRVDTSDSLGARSPHRTAPGWYCSCSSACSWAPPHNTCPSGAVTASRNRIAHLLPVPQCDASPAAARIFQGRHLSILTQIWREIQRHASPHRRRILRPRLHCRQRAAVPAQAG